MKIEKINELNIMKNNSVLLGRILEKYSGELELNIKDKNELSIFELWLIKELLNKDFNEKLNITQKILDSMKEENNIMKFEEKELKYVIFEDWQFDVIKNIFGEDNVNDLRYDRSKDIEYSVLIKIKRNAVTNEL